MTSREDIFKRLREFDYFVPFLTILLLGCGLLVMHSATGPAGSATLQGNFARQLIWSALGLIFLVVAAFVSTKWLYSVSYVGYAAGLVVLVMTLVLSSADSGPQRWLGFGGLKVQPSEFFKILLVLALARYFTDHVGSLRKQRLLIVPFLLTLAPVAIIVRQPDLGTAAVCLAILFPMLFLSGTPLFTLFVIVAPVVTLVSALIYEEAGNLYPFVIWIVILLGLLWLSRRPAMVSAALFVAIVSVGLLTPVLWNRLQPYQQGRIKSFVNLQLDPRGSNYQVIQSETAIGSGGLFGKGLGKGTQSQLKFLPEQHTDFIFSVIGEELGFVGVCIILSMFSLLLLRMLHNAWAAKNVYESLVIAGAASVFLFHIFVNIGITTRLLPVTGLPLPFLSYGGSSLVTSLILIGLVTNCSRPDIGTS